MGVSIIQQNIHDIFMLQFSMYLRVLERLLKMFMYQRPSNCFVNPFRIHAFSDKTI